MKRETVEKDKLTTPTAINPRNIFLKAALTGTLGLSLFYFFVLYLATGDINHPFSQFRILNPWISLVILGFGIQAGLFWLIKKGFRVGSVSVGKTMGVGTGTAGISMVVCCVHHLVEIVPILGLTGTFLLIAKFQAEMLIIAVVINTLGILYMLWVVTGRKNPFTIFSSFLKVIN